MSVETMLSGNHFLKKCLFVLMREECSIKEQPVSWIKCPWLAMSVAGNELQGLQIFSAARPLGLQF